MTDEEIRNGMADYLANHIDAAYWSGLTEEKRNALYTMAKLDVMAAVPSLNLDAIADPDGESVRPCRGDFLVAAIAEQSLHLSRNYSEQSSGRVVQSQTVGNLSQTFQYTAQGTLASRAGIFVNRLRQLMPRRLIWDRG